MYYFPTKNTKIIIRGERERDKKWNLKNIKREIFPKVVTERYG